ncbi:MAG TPA: YetF domain-containing protein [Thermoanaerobaculia bacterium]|nr:YetF domain-containing protein [Thermoanaerobaculia bacterium]
MHLTGLWRVLAIAPLSYILLTLVIRLAGKRVLSNMNPFDLLVTVAVGSTLATFVLDPQVKFWSGLLALLVPLALQFGIAWFSSHSKKIEKAVKQHPAILLLDGEMNHQMMHHEMITEDEVREAARKAGMTSLLQAKAIVLEVDGQLSVVRHSDEQHPEETSTLRGVKRAPNE